LCEWIAEKELIPALGAYERDMIEYGFGQFVRLSKRWNDSENSDKGLHEDLLSDA
jgi:hypothetical protein